MFRPEIVKLLEENRQNTLQYKSLFLKNLSPQEKETKAKVNK